MIRGEKGPSGLRKFANEAFARIEIDQQLKDTELTPTDVRTARFEYKFIDELNADYAPCCCQGGSPNALEAKRRGVNLSIEESQREIAQPGRR